MREERNHRAQNQVPRGGISQHVLVNNRPRIKKHDLDVEQDEQHRHEVEFDGEPRAAFADRGGAAFVGGVLGAVAFAAFAEDGWRPESSRTARRWPGRAASTPRDTARTATVLPCRKEYEQQKGKFNEENGEVRWIHFLNSHRSSVRITLTIRQVTMGKWKLKSPLE